MGRPADDAGLRDDDQSDSPATAANGAEDVPPCRGRRPHRPAAGLPGGAAPAAARRSLSAAAAAVLERGRRRPIHRLLQKRSENRELQVFLPKIAEAGSGRALHCRAAVAATFVAGLELACDGALTLQQDTAWQQVQVQALSGC